MLQHVPGQLQAAYVRVSLAQQLELGVRVGRATASFVTLECMATAMQVVHSLVCQLSVKVNGV